MSAEMQPCSQNNLIQFPIDRTRISTISLESTPQGLSSVQRFPLERVRPTSLPEGALVTREITNIRPFKKAKEEKHGFYQETVKEIPQDKERQAKLDKEYQRLITESGRAPSKYDPYFDQLYYTLLRQEYTPKEYPLKCEQLREGRIWNLVTFVGERLHVGISSYEATLVDGQIIPVGWPTSLVTMMEEGRAYRKKRNVCIEDQRREEAEVVGMRDVSQPGLNEAAEDDIYVSVSPPSGTYNHNFYDVFRRTKEGVRITRFTGGLSLCEYQEKTRQFYVSQGKTVPDSQVAFLRNPFLVRGDNPLKDPEKLHAYLHAEHASLSGDEFQKTVIPQVKPLLNAYMEYLEKGELTLEETELYINAIANKGDEAAGIRTISDEAFELQGDMASREYIKAYGIVPVRYVQTACDPSAIGGGGAWGVADFVPMAVRIPTPFGSREEFMTLSDLRMRYIHQDQHEARYFQCGSCGVYNVRPEGQLLPNCLGCKASAQCEIKKETEENATDLAA